MATTSHIPELLAQKIIPKEFKKGHDLEKFIKQCHRYFSVKNIIDEKTREDAMYCLLDVDLHEAYEKTEGKVNGFAGRLRQAFEDPKDMLEDLTNMLNYRKGMEKAAEFIQKVDNFVDKVLAHEWTKEKLTALMLVHACGNKEVEKEVVLKKMENVQEIKETILLMEKVEEKLDQVNAVRSYANIVQGAAQGGRKQTNKPTNQFQREFRLQCLSCKRVGHDIKNCPSRTAIECWTCGGKGHVSRNCPESKPPTCFACGKLGHIRRECQVVKCSRCGRNGHKMEECYTRLNGTGQNMRRFNGNFRGYNGKGVNVIEDNDEYIEELNSIHEEDCKTTYPKDKAPLVGELVGAIY